MVPEFDAAENIASRHHRFDRRELKFVISTAQRDAMLPVLAEHMEIDPYADSDGVYPIVSVYYDSPGREAYFERARGVVPRHKLRVRAYDAGGSTEAVFAEIKTKLRQRVVKRRIRLQRDEALALCHGERPKASLTSLETLLVDDILRMVGHRDLEPAIWLRYVRQAYVDPTGGGVRVTFDTEVAYRSRNPEGLDSPVEEGRVVSDTETVLEIKVDEAVPVWLTRLVGQKALTLQPFSKYCRSLELAGQLVGATRPVPATSRPARSPAVRAPAWKPSPSSSA